jgi:hypothetical protein
MGRRNLPAMYSAHDAELDRYLAHRTPGSSLLNSRILLLLAGYPDADRLPPPIQPHQPFVA